MTPLLVSTVHRHLEVTNLLIRLGASLDIPDTRHKYAIFMLRTK